MARKLLNTNDSAWLFAEKSKSPMQVGMLATLSVPEDQPTFVADLVARWREMQTFAPPFNYLFKTLPMPSWVELPDEEIDLDYHLRHSALPAPRSQRELGVLISRLHSAKMDRRYPLWECHVIEGVEDNKWSLYFKAHHSQVDGVGGIRLLKRMLSTDPDTRDMLPPWAVGTRGPDQSGIERPPSAIELIRPEGTSLIGGLVGVGKDVTNVATSLGMTYLETATGLGDDERAKPFRAPKSIFNGRIHTPRRFATQNYSIERIKTIAKAADGSVNDVFLTITGGALRRYLIDQDKLPSETLTANVPVSVRRGEGASIGNAITFLYAMLGTDIDDPIERIRHIKSSTRLGKERLPEVNGVAMDAYTAVLMLPFMAQAIFGIGGRGRPASNLVISNVPGPAEARYLNGSQLLEFYPVSLLFNGQALNVTAVSYDGSFNVGYTGCRDSIPSLQRIAVYSGEELDKLEASLGISEVGTASEPAAPKRRTRKAST